jgi:hypothetical protein
MGLALVQPTPTPSVAEPQPTIIFCSHCGRRPELTETELAPARVCGDCGLGVLLGASADIAPTAGDPFIVLDRSLAICAVSLAAEVLLAVCEDDAVHRHVTELLVPADSEAQAPANLASAVAWAARGDGDIYNVVVRPANTFGIRLKARIATCGPPQAALIAFD